jgi:putative photosynthetic complex assembly protein 2
MSYTVTAILAAMIIWWFSTGIILVFVRLAEKSGRLGGTAASLVALPSLLIGGWLYLNSLSDVSVGGAYAGFMAALFMWGWIELALLTGTITGPLAKPCPPDVWGFERFIWSWGAIAYHELALVLMLSFAVMTGVGAENTVGLWTVVTLYVARVSAKLNLFLGVPYINTEFLPEKLRYLASHFRRAKMNRFFPVSALLLGGALAYWVARLVGASDGATQAGYALLATLTALALLEHLLMILSLQDAKLWRWMLPKDDLAEGRIEASIGTTTNLKGGKNGI